MAAGKRKQDGGDGAGAGGGGAGGKTKKTKKSKGMGNRVKVARAAGNRPGYTPLEFAAQIYCYPPPKAQAGQWRAGFFLADVERKETHYGVQFEITYTEGAWAGQTDTISATDELWRIVPMGAFHEDLKADVLRAGTNAERASAARGDTLSEAVRQQIRSIRHIYGL